MHTVALCLAHTATLAQKDFQGGHHAITTPSQERLTKLFFRDWSLPLG
jgi:hypothetical protein